MIFFEPIDMEHPAHLMAVITVGLDLALATAKFTDCGGCRGPLKAIFPVAKVDMLKLPSYVSKHLSK